MVKVNELNLSETLNARTQTVLFEAIEDKLKTKKYDIKLTSAAERTLVSDIYRVAYKREDEAEDTRSKLLLKVAPSHETRRTQFYIQPLFAQEIYLYDGVLAYFRRFEQSKGVSGENSFCEYPRCYRTLDEEPNECLLLEDLTDRGFTTIDNFTEEVTGDHVYLVMKALGKFHTISLALKDQQPEDFEVLSSKIKETFIRAHDPFFRDLFRKQFANILTVLSEDDVHLLAKVKKLFAKEAIDIVADCIDVKLTGSATVITHGDAYQNNLMFRNDRNGKPIEVNLIDFQGSRHSSPIIDILYIIFFSTTKEIRDAHYEDFLKTYHESLSTHIRRLGSDSAKLFPHSLMMEHLRKFGKYGLIVSTIYLPGLTADKENRAFSDEDKNKGEAKDADFLNNFVSENSRKRYQKRLKDVIVDMALHDYI